jgi:septal ring factor EnvC (AmiA/AmiB activator)
MPPKLTKKAAEKTLGDIFERLSKIGVTPEIYKLGKLKAKKKLMRDKVIIFDQDRFDKCWDVNKKAINNLNAHLKKINIRIEWLSDLTDKKDENKKRKRNQEDDDNRERKSVENSDDEKAETSDEEENTYNLVIRKKLKNYEENYDDIKSDVDDILSRVEEIETSQEESKELLTKILKLLEEKSNEPKNSYLVNVGVK